MVTGWLVMMILIGFILMTGLATSTRMGRMSRPASPREAAPHRTQRDVEHNVDPSGGGRDRASLDAGGRRDLGDVGRAVEGSSAGVVGQASGLGELS